MVAEEGVETVEGRVRLEQGAGPVLHESSQLETYDVDTRKQLEAYICQTPFGSQQYIYI